MSGFFCRSRNGPTNQSVPWPRALARELAREEIASVAIHPIEPVLDFIGEVLVAAALIFGDRGVVTVDQVAIDIDGVMNRLVAVPLTVDQVKRNISAFSQRR